jgi:hypothetical protein
MNPADRLSVFLQRADYLADSALVKHSLGGQLTMSARQGQPMQWSSIEPSEPELESALLRLRPFLNEREAVHLSAVHNACYQAIRSDELRGYLVEARAEWSRAQRQGILALEVDGRQLTPEHVMDLFINGWYFHGDEAKRAELEALLPEVALLTRHIFLDYLYRAIEQVLYVAEVVREAKREGLVAQAA